MPTAQRRFADRPVACDDVTRGRFAEDGLSRLGSFVAAGQRIESVQQQQNTKEPRPFDYSYNEEEWRTFNAVGKMFELCNMFGWPEPTYSYTSKCVRTEMNSVDEHTVQCRLEAKTMGKVIMSTGVAGSKKSAKRYATIIAIDWLVENLPPPYIIVQNRGQ